MGEPPGGGAGGPGGGAGGGGGGSPPRGSGGEAAPPGAGPGGGPGGPGGAGGGPGALPYAERMQNVLVLGAAAFLQFTAYLTIQNFETSVFGDAGNKILFTCYFVHIFGSFISPFFTQRLGPRWALALSNLTYVAIVAGNLQSRIWLLALAFAAGGVGGGVWWTAHGEFLMGPACTGPGISFDRASGVFFGLYQFSGVAGNLAAAAILDLGLGFHVLVGLMTVLCALGGLMFFLLKEAPGPKAPRAAGGAHNEGLAALHWMRDPRAPWMWAIMFYWGLSQSYFFGQLPKMVPGMALTATVMACWSLANVVGSFFVGRFAGVWGRGPLLLATTALQTAGLLQSVAAARRGGTLELGHGGGRGRGGGRRGGGARGGGGVALRPGGAPLRVRGRRPDDATVRHHRGRLQRLPAGRVRCALRAAHHGLRAWVLPRGAARREEHCLHAAADAGEHGRGDGHGVAPAAGGRGRGAPQAPGGGLCAARERERPGVPGVQLP